MACTTDGCVECYNSIPQITKLIDTGLKPLSLVSSTMQCAPIDPKDNCLIYSYYNKKVTCEQCKQGYTLGDDNMCTNPSKIPDCSYSVTTNGVERCLTCVGGFPDPKNGCIKFDPKESGVTFKCLEGRIIDAGASLFLNGCARCELGFTANFRGYCYSTPTEEAGCMYDPNIGDCWACNYQEGYFQRRAHSA